MPMAASSSASDADTPSRLRVKRRRASEASRISSTLRACCNGNAGSIDRTAWRTAAARLSGSTSVRANKTASYPTPRHRFVDDDLGVVGIRGPRSAEVLFVKEPPSEQRNPHHLEEAMIHSPHLCDRFFARLRLLAFRHESRDVK